MNNFAWCSGVRARRCVLGPLSSNTVETTPFAVQEGLGIGMCRRVSLAGDLVDADVVNVLDEFIG